jgi:predicted acylesterase/phospholipase RssA
MLIPPRRIVLSGGGIRAVAHVGALKALHEMKYLSQIREWVGVSAGALICFLFSIGYTLPQVEIMCSTMDFGIVRSFEPENAFDFFDSFGVDSGENLEKLIRSVLKVKGHSPDMTFEEAAKKGLPLLRVYATNLRTCKLVEFSAKKTPKISLVSGLRATMCLPLYFKPVIDSTKKYVLTDGGVLGNYPIHHLSEDEQNESIGLTFDHDKSVVESVNSLMVFCSQLAASYYVPRNREQIEKHGSRTIILPCGDYPSWNFEASIEDRKRLMMIGYVAAKEFIKSGSQQKAPRGIRRYSVS